MGGFALVWDALGQVWSWFGFISTLRQVLTCSGLVSIEEAFIPFPALKQVTKPPVFSYILFLNKNKVSEPRNKLSVNLRLIHAAKMYGIIPKQEQSSACGLSKS